MMIAHVVSVIAGENDHGIVIKPFSLQLLQDGTNSIVDFGNHTVIGSHHCPDILLIYFIGVDRRAAEIRIEGERLIGIARQQMQGVRIVHRTVGCRRIKGVVRADVADHHTEGLIAIPLIKTVEGTLCDPFAGIKRKIEIRLTALAVIESVIFWRKLKQTGFVVQIKTVDFTVLHQKMMIIVLEASAAVLLCQLKIGKSDVQISGSHVHFPDCGGLVSVFTQELWKSRIAGGQCTMVVPCSMLVHIQTAE